jgi:hypothetical protein
MPRPGAKVLAKQNPRLITCLDPSSIRYTSKASNGREERRREESKLPKRPAVRISTDQTNAKAVA